MYEFSFEELLLYLRKSQSDDPTKTVEEVLAKHESILQELAVRLCGQKIPEHQIYREVVSGESIEQRTEMQKVLKMIESANYKGVLVVDPQRLSRGDLVDCGTIINAFRYSSTLVITPSRTFDLTEKYDRKFFEMELSHGADYLEYCKEILARGRLASVMKGNYIGKDAPYGYKKLSYKEGRETVHTLEIEPTEAEGIRMAFDLFVNKGMGFVNVAHALDEFGFKPRSAKHWSPETLKDMLENPVYIGKIRWNHRKEEKTMVNGELKVSRPKRKDGFLLIDGRHPAIISEELYQGALDRRGKNIRVKSKVAVRNPLSGLVYCQCGRAMTYRTHKDPRTKRERSAPRLLCDGQTHCGTRSATYSDVEERVITYLERTIADFKIKLKNTSSVVSQQNIIQNLEKRIAELGEKEISLWEKYTDEDMPKHIFDALMQKVETERKSAKASLQRLQNTEQEVINYQERIVCFSEALAALQDSNVPAEEKNLLLKKCIDKIIYDRKTVNIIDKRKKPRTISGEINLDFYGKL